MGDNNTGDKRKRSDTEDNATNPPTPTFAAPFIYGTTVLLPLQKIPQTALMTTLDPSGTNSTNSAATVVPFQPIAQTTTLMAQTPPMAMPTLNTLSTDLTQAATIAPSPMPTFNALSASLSLARRQAQLQAKAIVQLRSAAALLAQSTSMQAMAQRARVFSASNLIKSAPIFEPLKTTAMPTSTLQATAETAAKPTVASQATVEREPTPTLDAYGTNLTKLAEQGKLSPLVGREGQLESIIKILCRQSKSNPCLIGEPGVGKTAIVEGLAQRILRGHVPQKLKNMKVISLDTANLVSGATIKGQVECRLAKLIKEVQQSDDIILFMDELHVLVKGYNMNHVDIWKPALARGSIRCIGATTVDEYKKYIEKDLALERRFIPVKVPEPSVDETIKMLKGIHGKYETHHQLRYTDEALVAAAKLSNRYISGRFLPDKAFDLIDMAGSDVRFLHELEHQEQNEIVKMQNGDIVVNEGGNTTPLIVTEFDIQRIISSWTGIPVNDVSRTESQRLLKLEETFNKYIIGQEEAIKAISFAIRRARVDLKGPNRPIASLLFTGPTGVGKTELAKTLAREYLGSERAMVRFDMSEFMERYSVSLLIGSPPDYIGSDKGGVLTEAVRSQPHSLCLFDEIEKAHVETLNIMLQIMDDGMLRDNQGCVVDFSNTLIIMTSNVGSSIISQGIGVSDLDHSSNNGKDQIINKLVNEELKRQFRAEFLNRFDEVIVFKQLTKLKIKKIAELMLEQVNERLKDKEIKLQVTDRFKDWLLEQGYNPNYGARELRRAITRVLEDTLAEKLLKKEIRGGDIAIVDVNDDGKVVIGNI